MEKTEKNEEAKLRSQGYGPADPEWEEQEEGSSIDYMKLLGDVKRHRRLYYKVLSVTFVAACILALSLPNYYKCTVMLAPELTSGSSSSSLLSLASSFGLNLGRKMGGTSEALFPTLYPELMNSVDFKTSLFNVKVHKKDSTRMMTYYDYLKEEQKIPWWSMPLKWLGDQLEVWFYDEEAAEREKRLDPFELTKAQTRIAKALDKKVVCDVDNKTLVISIDVTDQDPLIAATIADSVKERLQAFITDYRTSKARVDLEYNRKLYDETKARYDKARRLYAEFADANQDVILETVRQRQTELENEMQLQYNAYTQVASQLMAAEAKVQEETPAFTTLQSATVPVKKAGPKRKMILLVLLFLAFCGTTAWVFYKEDDLKPLLGM